MMKNLTTLPGAPESGTVTRGSVDDGLFPLLSRKSDVSELEGLNRRDIANNTRMQRESPFNAPPFVTLQEMEDHKKDSGIEDGEEFQPSRTG
jgi:hypothetical protein